MKLLPWQKELIKNLIGKKIDVHKSSKTIERQRIEVIKKDFLKLEKEE